MNAEHLWYHVWLYFKHYGFSFDHFTLHIILTRIRTDWSIDSGYYTMIESTCFCLVASEVIIILLTHVWNMHFRSRHVHRHTNSSHPHTNTNHHKSSPSKHANVQTDERQRRRNVSVSPVRKVSSKDHSSHSNNSSPGKGRRRYGHQIKSVLPFNSFH